MSTQSQSQYGIKVPDPMVFSQTSDDEEEYQNKTEALRCTVKSYVHMSVNMFDYKDMLEDMEDILQDKKVFRSDVIEQDTKVPDVECKAAKFEVGHDHEQLPNMLKYHKVAHDKEYLLEIFKELGVGKHHKAYQLVFGKQH